MSGVYNAGCGNSACLGIITYIDKIQEKKGVLTTMGLQERGIEALGPFLCLTEKEKRHHQRMLHLPLKVIQHMGSTHITEDIRRAAHPVQTKSEYPPSTVSLFQGFAGILIHCSQLSPLFYKKK